MVTNNFFKSDLPKIHNIVQNAMTLYPKELVVAQLRDFFSQDTTYHYVHDKFGFPQTPDNTDLDSSAGLNDNVTTRLFIGENYRKDIVYYPAIIVRSGGSTSTPISFNRETSSVQWDYLVFQDGYGNIKKFPTPKHFIFAGAWEGSLNIDILAKDLRTRDDLVDLVSLLFVDIAFNDLVKSGLVVKNVSAGSPSETDDRNDKLFRQSITLQIRSEWRRHIPVGNIIEIINTSIEFGRIEPENSPVALNLTIKNSQNLIDLINQLE